MNKTAKHKYAIIGFIYLLGLICASFLDSTACFIIFILLGLVYLFAHKLRLYIFVTAMSFLVMGFYGRFYVEKSHMLVGRELTVDGMIMEVLSPDNDTVMLTVSGTAEGTPISFTLFTTDTGIRAGDRVSFSARFTKLTDSAEFSQTGYYYSKGIFLRAYASGEITVLSSSVTPYSFVSSISDYFKNQIDRVLSGDEGGIIKAIFFGDKSGLSDKLSVSVKRAGVSHLVAVSGMHLTLIVHFIAIIFSRFIKRNSPIISVVFILCVVFLMLFFGMTASVMRSGLMLAAVYGSGLFKRRTNILGSISGALLIILIPAPYACRDIGLWLSVLGTLGVGKIGPMIADFIHKRLNKRVNRELISSIFAFLFTFPVGALCFGGVSLLSILTGIIISPLFAAILTLVLISVMSLGLFSYPLLFAAGFIAKLMNAVIFLIGGLSFSYVRIDNESLMTFIAVFLPALIATLFVSRKIRYIVRLSLASFMALVASALIAEIITFNNIKLYVYSDGADALIIAEDKKGVSFFTLSDSPRIAEKISEFSVGKDAVFLCIADSTHNNPDIALLADYLGVHLPDYPAAEYNIGGEYSAKVYENEIILSVRGIDIGLFDIESERLADIGIYNGYKKDFSEKENSATILADKRFYNCEENLNAYYTEVVIIINEEGAYAFR